VRFALLAWPLATREVEALCERLRVPNEVRELALAASRNREALRAVKSATPQELLDLLKRADAFRRPERFAELLQVASLSEGFDTARLERALRAAAAVDAGAIAAQSAPAEIARRIDEARVQAIAQAL
jgi:tRNA nucleotidyltransferase (CCA-adding enzyme)